MVGQCLGYVVANINEILRMPIDLNCLNSALIDKLVSLLDVDAVEAMVDRKDKLQSKLYKKKLEGLLGEEARQLLRCTYCGRIFTAAQAQWMVCAKAKIFLDFHGNVIAQHVAARSFDFHKYLLWLRNKSLSWRDIYWRIWAMTTTLYCTVCKRSFVARHMAQCTYHAVGATFDAQGKSGTRLRNLKPCDHPFATAVPDPSPVALRHVRLLRPTSRAVRSARQWGGGCVRRLHAPDAHACDG